MRWIQQANRLEFMNLPDDQLRNKVICGLHFEDKYFTNDQKKRLVHDAIPTLDAGCFETANYVKDVEILPTSVDGSTFTLQGENLQSSGCGNENFSFKDGKVMLQNFANNLEVYTINPSYIQQSFTSNKDMFINQSESLMLMQESQTEEKDSIFNDLDIIRDHCLEKEVKPEPKIKQDISFDVCISPPIVPLANGDCKYNPGIDTAPIFTGTEDVPPKSSDKIRKVKLKKPTLLKTLNYHSQEIANIKRSLASTKFSRAKILRSLKGKIPETMFGALSLQLNKTCSDLKPEEKSFLHALHTIAPTAHKTLEDYGWHMPKHEINNGTIDIK